MHSTSNMTRLLYFICLALKPCAFAVLFQVSQPESAVRVQLGHTTSLQCFTPDDGHFEVFWLKFHNSSAPVVVARSGKTDTKIGEKFNQDPSKYRLTWNQLSFNLSILNIEQTDIAVYYCGIIIYNRMCFGNGTRLMFKEHFNGKELIKEKEDSIEKQHVYVLPTLVTIIVVSILLNVILCYILKKHKEGMSQTDASQNSKTEDVNYASLRFTHNQRKTKPRPKKDFKPQVIYGVVRHQEK